MPRRPMAGYTVMNCTLIPQGLVQELMELGFTETSARERVRQELGLDVRRESF